MRRFSYDLHTHSVYSDGTGTPMENVMAAEEKGLELVAITDHGPASPEGLTEGSFRRLLAEVKEAERMCSVRALAGVEANIVSPDGGLDVTPAMLEEADVVLAGVHHPHLIAPGAASVEELKAAVVRATIECMESGEADVIAHPVWILEELRCHVTVEEAREIAETAADTGTALELNVRHLPRDFTLYQIAVQVGAPITVGSDAHSPWEVGEFKPVSKVLRRVGLTPEDVDPRALGLI